MKNWKEVLCDEVQWPEFKDDMSAGSGRMKLQSKFGISERGVQNLMKLAKAGSENEITAHRETYLSTQAVKYRDKFNNIKRTSTADTRYSNAVEELLSEVLDVLKVYDFKKFMPVVRSCVKNEERVIGILQLADLHLNECVELIDTLGFNKFSYAEAVKRLKKHVETARKYFKAEGVTEVLVANTGDVLNSDRRLDEIVTNSGNRSKAMIIAVDIIKQLLLDLSKDYKVSYLTVAGNEARKYDEMTFNNATFSNNYDVDIHTILSYLLQTSDIDFKPLVSAFETLVDVNGNNIVFIHGQQLKAKDPEHSITKIFAKYSQAGYKINYVICGHIHSTYNSDFFSRSSSLVGDNSYSNNCLLLTGKAAQNIYIVRPKSINTITVDLQDISTQDTSYDYDEELARGTTQMKSRKKLNLLNTKEIIKVVI